MPGDVKDRPDTLNILERLRHDRDEAAKYIAQVQEQFAAIERAIAALEAAPEVVEALSAAYQSRM